LDYETENCSLALHIPEYGFEAMMEITRIGSSTIDVRSLAVALDDNLDSQRTSFRSLLCRVDNVGSFTPDVQCDGAAVESHVVSCFPVGLSAMGTQVGLLGRRGEHKREANCNGAWIISPLGIYSLTAIIPGLYLGAAADDLIV
jgi:hypothetical protein